jgi:hypothetical protein
MNFVKAHLAKQLDMHGPGETFNVKRNNSYAYLANDTFKMLDVTSYMSPGVSYDKFLKAFEVAENKGYFPYEWLDDVDKLNHPNLPSHEDFYSSLKDCNISPEEYQFCQHVWSDYGMSTFQDFLIWYSNLDVGPFVQAVEHLQKIYFDRGIDVFNTSISVFGLARRMLFDTGCQAGAFFALFDEANSDLYDTIKRNLTAGPSIIFNVYHEVGQAYIRNDFTRPCQKILGFDANALYLWSIDQEIPTGTFVRRRLADNFKPHKRDKFTLMYDWMDYRNHSQGLHIRHKLNTGKKRRSVRIPSTATTPILTPSTNSTGATGTVTSVG